MKMTKNPWFWLALSVLICFIGSFGANRVQSANGSIEISPLRLQTDEGQIQLLLYKPKTATVNNPAPAVIVCSGMEDNLQKQADYAVELARRGCVVIAMDQACHGNTDEFNSIYWVQNDAGQYYNITSGEFVDNQADATRFNAHGMIDVVEYVWKFMGFVDRSRIGVTGHSQGGVNSTRTVRYYHYQGTVGDGINKISALFSQSCNERINPGEMDGIDAGYVVGYVDEIFVGSLNREMPNGINTMQELLQYHANELVSNNSMYALTPDKVRNVNYKMGTYVYDANGNIRVFNINPGDHCVQHWYTHAIENAITFFMASFKMNPSIPSTNQVWQLKETFNGIGLIGFFMFVVAICGVLLRTPFFRTLQADEKAVAVAMQEKPKTTLEYVIYIAGLIILGFLPGYLFQDLMAKSWVNSSETFPLPTLNQYTQFVIVIAGIILAYLLVIHFVFNRKKGYTWQTYGLSLRRDGDTAKDIVVNALKTVLLGLIVVVSTYSIIFISVGIFNVDYRFFELGINTFTHQRISHITPYILFWLIWSFALAIAVNFNFRKGWNEWVVLAVTTVVNAVGLGVMLIPYFVTFYQNGRPYNYEKGIGSIFRLFPMIPIIIFVTILSRRIYKKTGNVYLTTIVNGLLVLVATLSNVAVTFYFIRA